MKKLVYILFIVISAYVHAQYDPGKTRGNFSASPRTGSAEYNIPFVLPPGIKDLAPKLGLSYSSLNGNGIAGWGWNISGLSTISRIPSSKKYGGEDTSVTFSKKDHFALDGKRLILKSGKHGEDGAEYTTELYSNIKIIAYGNSASGPVFFVARFPNGTQVSYGNRSDSTNKLEWAISEIRDCQRNTINFWYQNDNGLLTIREIEYGSGSTSLFSPANHLNSIKFIYKKKLRPEISYINGVAFKRTDLLSSIEIETNNIQYRKYVLTHDKTSLDYQRLVAVQEYNSDNKSFVPITFEYGNTVSGLKELKTRKRNDIDVNGLGNIVGVHADKDGKMDFITYSNKSSNRDQPLLYSTQMSDNHNSLIYKNVENVEPYFYKYITGSEIRGSLKQRKEGFMIFAYDKSGVSSFSNDKVKIMNYYPRLSQHSKYYLSLQNENLSFSEDNFQFKSNYKHLSGDFDGDGYMEILCFTKEAYLNKIKIIYFNNDENHFSKLKNIDIKNIALPLASESEFFTGDFNGDGKSDIIQVSKGKVHVYTIKNEEISLLHTEQDAIFKVERKLSPSFDYSIIESSVLTGDFNGDGKIDILVPTEKENYENEWKFFVSTGRNFKKHTTRLEIKYLKDGKHKFKNDYHEYKYVVQDYNKDGKSDIIVHEIVNPNEDIKGFSVRPNPRSKSIVTLYENMLYENGLTYFKSKEIDSKTYLAIGKSGAAISLKTSLTNPNSTYAYFDGKHLFRYELSKDHREDMLLKRVVNNSMTQKIEYEKLGFAEEGKQKAYTGPDSYELFRDDDKAPFIVKRFTEYNTSNSFIRYQDFQYDEVKQDVSADKIFFSKSKRTNLYGNGVAKLWTISKYNKTLGSIIEEWLSTSSNEKEEFIKKKTYTYDFSIENKRTVVLLQKLEIENKLLGTKSTKTISYDDYKNPKKEITTFSGGMKEATYEYSNDVTSNRNYHVGRLTKRIEKNTIGSNSFSKEKVYEYYSNSNLLKEQKIKGTDTSWNIESFEYDKFGNITKKTLSPSGMAARTQSFTYSDDGRFLKRSTDVEGLVTTFTYDNFGNPLTSTNPYGQTTTFTYDGWNRLKREIDYLGKATTFLYENIFNGGMRQTIKHPQGGTEVEEYNALGLLVKTKELGLNGKWRQKSFGYDVAGRKIRESEPYFSNPSQWNTTAYDTYGRIITQTKFTGQVGRITYSGLTTTVNDGIKTIITTKDGGGNTLKTQDPGGTITYTYHGNGTMKTADYGGHVVRTEIDGWGRKTKLVDPSAGTYTYQYNSLGKIKKETTPKGATHYTYTNVGKIKTKKVEGDNTNMNLTYVYDTTTKLLKNITGKNTRVNESYSYTYTYDNQKRPYITKESNGKANFEHRVGYDGFGRIETESYISKSNNTTSTVTVTNVYDTTTGILTEIKNSANKSLWKLEEANERGQAKEIALGNGMVKNRTYDNNGLLTNLKDATTGDTPTIALNVNYVFDTKGGNLKSRKNNNFNWSEDFTYDSLDRLTNISGSVKRNQTYDTRGRIKTNSEVGSYQYVSGNYQLKDIELNTKGDLHYQNNPQQQITYNAYKKPISIIAENNGRVDFEYGILQNRSHAYYGGNDADKNNRRYQKHYSGITPVEIETDKQGNTKIITYIGGDAYSAPVVHVKQTQAGKSNGFHYLHRDYLGSILAITDSAGKVTEQRQFGAWGEVDRFKTGNSEVDFTHERSLVNRGYTGHEHFVEVGLIHMNGRMYDAKLGRFLSPDNNIQAPFSTQSFNRYGYVWNNPLKFNDPSGEWVEWLIVAAFVYLKGAHDNRKSNGAWNWNPFKWDKFPDFMFGSKTEVNDSDVSTNVNLLVSPTGTNTFINTGVQTQVNFNVGNNSEEPVHSPIKGGVTIETEDLIMTSVDGEVIEGNEDLSYDNSAFEAAIPLALVASAADGPAPFGDLVGAIIMGKAAGDWVADNHALIVKQTTEIERILRKKILGNGILYELRVNRSGRYIDVRGNAIDMKAGDIWKYGETTQGIKGRYTRSELDKMVPGGVTPNIIYYGNNIDIKVQEKIMIYGYFLMNGKLPPGNRIFR